MKRLTQGTQVRVRLWSSPRVREGFIAQVDYMDNQYPYLVTVTDGTAHFNQWCSPSQIVSPEHAT